jgi:hypothetical protein
MGIKLIKRFQENVLRYYWHFVCMSNVWKLLFINFEIVVRLLRVAFFYKFTNKSLSCICSNSVIGNTCLINKAKHLHTLKSLKNTSIKSSYQHGFCYRFLSNNNQRIGLQYGNLAKIVLTTCTRFFWIEVYVHKATSKENYENAVINKLFWKHVAQGSYIIICITSSIWRNFSHTNNDCEVSFCTSGTANKVGNISRIRLFYEYFVFSSKK